jgi:hypothetical protein
MASLGRIARLLARVVAAGTLVYLACLLTGDGLLRATTAAARGVLRLVERPAILTSLSSGDAHVVIATYLSGVERPLATWDATNLPIFLVATLGLALAAPARDVWQRLATVLLAGLSSVVTMVATVVVQLQVTASNEARARLGLLLYDQRGESLLASANQAIGIAMLLVPAAVFAFSYVRFRERGEADAGEAGANSRRASGWQRPFRLAAGSALASLIFFGLVRLGATTVDPRPGLLRVVELNPAAYQARLALTSYDAVIALHRR